MKDNNYPLTVENNEPDPITIISSLIYKAILNKKNTHQNKESA